MDLDTIMDGADRFAAYVEELTRVIGHADRAAPLRDYCAGLLTAEGRKSVEPMAAVTAPARVSVQHQKLLHLSPSTSGAISTCTRWKTPTSSPVGTWRGRRSCSWRGSGRIG
jgi:SRSO17 transposase